MTILNYLSVFLAATTLSTWLIRRRSQLRSKEQNTAAEALSAWEEKKALRILVADDIEDNRFMIQLYLKNMPYHLEFASDGEEVMEKWKNEPAFDLILMDMHMPKIDGYEATQEIRNQERIHGFARTPIIAFTASGREDESARNLSVGCDRHVIKPTSREDLQKIISETVKDGDLNTVYVKKEVQKLIPRFLENRRNELKRLESAILKVDFALTDEIAHGLKGVAGTFGFRRMADLGQEIQNAAKISDEKKVKELYGSLNDHFKKMRITYV